MMSISQETGREFYDPVRGVKRSTHNPNPGQTRSTRDTLDARERSDRPLAAIILAAGKGTRIPGDLAKVAHEVAGRPMIEWVVEAVRAVGAKPIVLVVGYGQEVIRDLFDGDAEIEFVEQTDPQGTAHAVEVTRPRLDQLRGDVIVLAGDGPLIRPRTLEALVHRHRSTGAAATLATAVIDNPGGYGRIVRDERGRFQAIVEDRIATPAERAIREINPSYYCFDIGQLFDTLLRVKRDPVSGEMFLTDVPGLLKQEGKRVEVLAAVPPEEVLSINTPEQLREVDAILSARMEACR